MYVLPIRLCLLLFLAALFCPLVPARSQTAGSPGKSDHVYKSSGKTDQPFTVQIVSARRTVLNILLVKFSLSNDGTEPLDPRHDFCGGDDPADNDKISAMYAVDPADGKKYGVVRDAQNAALCSTITPPVRPGERRMLFIQLLAPPPGSGVVDLYFPKAEPILGVPVSSPPAGQPSTSGPEVIASPSAAPAAGVQP